MGMALGLRQNLDFSTLQADACRRPPAHRAGGDCAVSGLGEWAAGAGDPGEAKVIALLNEQKQAIIHRAVTRGLDPSSPSNPPASPGSATFRSIGRCGGAKYLFGEVDERSTDGSEELLSVSHLTGVTPTQPEEHHDVQGRLLFGP